MKKIVFIILCLLPLISNAQPKQGHALIDSLLKELNIHNQKGKDDTIRTAIMIELCYDYYDIDPDKGLQFGKQGLALSENLKLKSLVANAYYYLGLNYCVKADYPTALANWLKALKINEEIGDKERIANTLMNIGRIYVVQKNTGRALEYYLKALKINEDTRDTVHLPITLDGIGTAYWGKKDYASALEYYTRALEANKRIHSKEGVADNTANIGLVTMDQGKYASALEIFFKALKLNEELGNKNNLSNILGNIGYCYLSIAKDKTGNVERGHLVPNNTRVNLKKSIEYLDKAIALRKEIGNNEELQNFVEDRSQAEELMGDYKAALSDYKKYEAIKDTAFNIENNVKIANLETQRGLELKQKDIEIADKKIALDELAVAKKRNERVYFIGGLGLLVAVIVVVFRNYKIQQTSNTALTKTNALLTTEKKRSDDLLLNVLPAEVAEELKEKGKAHAKLYDDVTVIFTDFVDFTMNTGNMSPQQIVGELDECFNAFDRIIDKYKIEKIKTIGDAYLAVAGLPTADPDHAENIVRAAREINIFMQDRFAKLGNNTFNVRIGIHSGSVVAGIVGVKKFAYDIWGDTVNTAARMEQSSKPGKINISETTFELIKDKFDFEYRGEIDVKGKGQLKMYFLA